MRARIDKEKCTGCSICQTICPEVFSVINIERRPMARVHSNIVPEEAELFCVDARDCCKTAAIQLYE